MTKVISLAPQGRGKKGEGLLHRPDCKILKRVQDDSVLSEAHGKELNVLKSYRLNDFKKKAGATHVDMSGNIRRAAFTLAEVLITLAIIGVVAAMTIPTLIAKYQERQVVSSLTKVYSTLASAYQMVQAEYGPLSTWGLKTTVTGEVNDEDKPIYDHSANKLIVSRLKKYLKVAKTCEAGKVCFPGAWYSINGIKTNDAGTVLTGSNTSDSAPEERFFLNDGTYVHMGNYTAYAQLGSIFVVLPIGKDAVLGKNRFYFVFNDKGLFPAGMKDTTWYSFEDYGCDPAATYKTAGMGCAAWVIYNKNMDYLHCREKLDWDGPHSCKEAEN